MYKVYVKTFKTMEMLLNPLTSFDYREKDITLCHMALNKRLILNIRVCVCDKFVISLPSYKAQLVHFP